MKTTTLAYLMSDYIIGVKLGVYLIKNIIENMIYIYKNYDTPIFNE